MSYPLILLWFHRDPSLICLQIRSRLEGEAGVTPQTLAPLIKAVQQALEQLLASAWTEPCADGGTVGAGGCGWVWVCSNCIVLFLSLYLSAPPVWV